MINPKRKRDHLPSSQVAPQKTLTEKPPMLDAGKTQI